MDELLMAKSLFK